MMLRQERMTDAVILCVAGGVLGGAGVSASAASVSPDVIFGSGNANGSFTVDQNVPANVELGLRAKLRFDASNQPANIFNYNLVDTYTFQNGTPPSGFGFAPNATTTPIWNFEWSINSDISDVPPGGGGLNTGWLTDEPLNRFTYRLSLDADPGPGTNFLTFDPINVDLADHALGNNSFGNDEGIVATTEVGYQQLIGNGNPSFPFFPPPGRGYNVAQNSWSYEFFNDPGSPLENFDPNQTGTYTIKLEAFDGGVTPVASTSIDVEVVPEPATLALAGIGGLVFLSRRVGRRSED